MEKEKKTEPISSGVGSPFFMCTQQALRYLSIREHNRAELKRKLSLKGYESSLIEDVLNSLEDDNSLSEIRYIESFVRSSNKRHPEGKSILLARLIAKGVNRATAKEVLDFIYNEEYTSFLAQKAYERIAVKELTPQEIKARLKKLGFTSSDIKT